LRSSTEILLKRLKHLAYPPFLPDSQFGLRACARIQPMAVQERRFTIRTAEVMQAQRALLRAIEQRVWAGDLTREIAEGQLSGLLADVWNEASRALRSLPAHIDTAE